MTQATTAPARTQNEEAFLRLAIAHGASMAGDAMVTVALAGSIFFSTNVNGARGRVLLSMLLTIAPFVVVAPFLGPAIDKSKGGRRMMVILACVGRCIAVFYMARVVHNLLLFLPAALAVLILSKAHAIAKSALVPATVDSPADLVRAGGRLAVVAAVAGFVAGGPAWVVWHVFSAAWALRLAGVVYLVGAIMAMRTRPAPPAQVDPPDHVDEFVRSRGVSLAAVGMASIRGISGFLTFAVAFGFRRLAHSHTWWFGLVLGAALIGGFIGNVTGPKIRNTLKEERMLLIGLLAVAAAGLLVALLGAPLAIVIVAFAVGMADGIGQLSFDALVQRDGSEGSRARSFARYEATFQLTWVLAAVIPVAIPIPIWVAALMIGLAATASAINYAAGRYVVSRHRPGPDPSDPAETDPNSWPELPGPAANGSSGHELERAPRVTFPRKFRTADTAMGRRGAMGIGRRRRSGTAAGPHAPGRPVRRRAEAQPQAIGPAADVRAVVLSDTHIRRGSARRLPDAVYSALDQADVVLHAGDVLEEEVLDELGGFAPVRAVLGNNDYGLAGVLPVSRVEVLDGVRVGMIHDSGPRAGRAGRMARRFPDAAVVVFGHSHAPCDEVGVSGQRLFNPGSPTERRSQPRHTFGELDLVDGAVVGHRIIPL